MNHNDFKRDLYVTKRIQTDERDDNGNRTSSYAVPVLYQIVYRPLNAETTMKEIGLTSTGVQKAVIVKHESTFDLFELEEEEEYLVYLDNASPNKKPKWDKVTQEEKEPINGYWSNYKVISIREFFMTKEIYFERLQGRPNIT